MVRSGLSIVIVDDSVEYRFLLNRKLKALHIGMSLNITEFANGLDALTHLLHLPQMPHIIFLDIEMPVMDGLEFLQAYGSNNLHRQGTSIYVLSNHADERVLQQAAAMPPVTGVYAKDIAIATLRQLLAPLV